MKLVAVFGDADVLVKDYLKTALATRSEPYKTGVTCGLVVPATWTVASAPFVLVAWDGTPEMIYPALAKATVRVTTWHATASKAKALAGLCMALLLAHPGGGGIGSINPLTGLLPAVDDDNHGDLASFTVRANLRGTAL